MSDSLKEKIQEELRELEQRKQKLERMLELLDGSKPKHLDGAMKNKPKRSKPASIAEAIKAALAENPTMQLNEIYHYLRDQFGIALKGQNPRMTVYSSLKRHPDIFTKVPNKGWKLTK